MFCFGFFLFIIPLESTFRHVEVQEFHKNKFCNEIKFTHPRRWKLIFIANWNKQANRQNNTSAKCRAKNTKMHNKNKVIVL